MDVNKGVFYNVYTLYQSAFLVSYYYTPDIFVLFILQANAC